MTKLSYGEVSMELSKTSRVCLEKRGSYAYATGVYEAMLVNMVLDMPKHKQNEFMRALQETQERLNAEE